MSDVVFDRCCEGAPEGKIQEGWVSIRCPDCGMEMRAFPANALETTNVPNERFVSRLIAEKAANRWNTTIATRRLVNG